MGFHFSMDLFLGNKAFDKKKLEKVLVLHTFFYILEDLPLYSFFVFGGVELLGLGLLVHSCCNPPQEEDGRGGGKLGW